MFAIFLNSLGKELNSTGLGIDIGNINIAAIFFADDLVIVAKSKKALKALMRIARKYFKRHKLQISESKSKIMAYDASSGEEEFSECSEIPTISLEKVCSYKYLGIPLSISPYCLFKDYHNRIKTRGKTIFMLCYLLQRMVQTVQS